jgi:hypothetical protein
VNNPILVTLMMEELHSSETIVLKRATRRNIQEDTILHSHRRENLKSYTLLLFFTVALGETESTWYVVHYLPHYTRPGRYMIMSVEQSVEWDQAREIVVLGENMPQWQLVHHKSHVN